MWLSLDLAQWLQQAQDSSRRPPRRTIDLRRVPQALLSGPAFSNQALTTAFVKVLCSLGQWELREASEVQDEGPGSKARPQQREESVDASL